MLTGRDIVEIIMTQHRDKSEQDCACWVCKAGRDQHFTPRNDFLHIAYETVPIPTEGV